MCASGKGEAEWGKGCTESRRAAILWGLTILRVCVCVCTDLHISHFTQYVYSTNVPFFFLIKEEINQTQTGGNVSDASRVENNF